MVTIRAGNGLKGGYIMIWRVDYVVGNTYKVKYITAETAEQAIKKARVKNIVDLNIQESR